MQFVIWGAGKRGERLYYHLGKEHVVAFIDENKAKIGQLYHEVKIIDLETYKKEYREVCIVISTHEKEIVSLLKKNNIYHYFLMSECPENFQSANPRMILKQCIKREIDINKKYLVYGNSLYSILLYSWLKEKNMVHNPYIFLGINANKIIAKSLKNEWGEAVLSGVENLDKIDIVLNTEDPEESNILKELPSSIYGEIENVLRYSEKIRVFYNQKIERYKGIYPNGRCFIIGLGPSLSYQDLEVLYQHQEVCISVNSIYRIFEQTNWRPTYYVTTEDSVMKYEKDLVLNSMKGVNCFISDEYEPFCREQHDDNIMIYHLGRQWKDHGYIPFSEDFAKIAYNNGTVLYAALELAVYMGFKEIYLLGVDASGINGKYDTYKHFYEESNPVGICFSDQVYVSYVSAKRFADQHSINIYNATRGGELEVFERVNFDKLF